MSYLILLASLTFSLGAFSQETPQLDSSGLSLVEKIQNSERERQVLRARILESQYFAQFKAGKSGDEIEALIYSVGNFLTYGTHRAVAKESALQKQGRHLASASNPDGDGVLSLKAYIQNRHVLNSLYLQRRRERFRLDPSE